MIITSNPQIFRGECAEKLKFFSHIPGNGFKQGHELSRSCPCCLGFAPRSQRFVVGALPLFTHFVRYPDSLRFVRPQIRFSHTVGQMGKISKICHFLDFSASSGSKRSAKYGGLRHPNECAGTGFSKSSKY